MAKCSLCAKTKGKRNCLAYSGILCSSCCGSFREKEKCEGCAFFKTGQQTRRYEKAPYFTTHQMAEDERLQGAGDVMEEAICAFDLSRKRITDDAFYQRVMERLLDHYHFRDEHPTFSDALEEECFAFIEEAIGKDLPGMSDDFLSRIIGAVYRSIKRHAGGRYASRAYINFVHQFVGVPKKTEAHLLPSFIRDRGRTEE